MDNGFGVAAGAVAVALRFEIGAQGGIVIDLPVVNDPNVAGFVGKRLVASFDVDDAQSPHRQTDILFDKIALVVGTAMQDSAIHRRQRIAAYMPVSISKKDSTDSAHRNFVLDAL
jgi:hypothetical protein